MSEKVTVRYFTAILFLVRSREANVIFVHAVIIFIDTCCMKIFNKIAAHLHAVKASRYLRNQLFITVTMVLSTF